MAKLAITLYRKLYLIRRAEEKIQEYYTEDEMKTPMHMSMGAEAIAVGVCQALAPDDQVFGSYRSHAIYLAKTQNTDDFFAEMWYIIYIILSEKLGFKIISEHRR